MAQTLKEETRQSILTAAEELFAQASYTGATMAAVANQAGISTGNIYRYFKNKDVLFEATVSQEFASEFLQVLRRRVASLTRAGDLTRLDGQAQADAEGLHQFWVTHRRKVIILLNRAQGSCHEPFAERFVEELVKATCAKLKQDLGDRRLRPVVSFTLRNVFRNTLITIVSILEHYERESEFREAFQSFWSYQLGGLAAFEKWVVYEN